MTILIRNVNNPYHDEKLFWPYHAQKAQTILRGEIPSPSLIEIDPTDEGCNQSCIHCCFGSGSNRMVRKIDVQKLLCFVAEAYEYGVYAYELVGGGEPTAHPGIASIIIGITNLAKPNCERPHIGMVTNGILLERVFSVAHCLDFLRVSLDAADATTYSVLHGINPALNHFEKVLANIKTLVSFRGGKQVRLGYLVVPPHNHKKDAIRRFIDLSLTLGVEHVAFRPAFLKYGTDREVWQETSDIILEEQSRHRSGFILGGSGGSWENALGNQEHPSGLCRIRPLVLTIKSSGVIPSCFLYRDRLTERPAIGHISEGFLKVWFNKSHLQSIQTFNRSSCPDVCKFYRSQRALERLEILNVAGSNIPVIADTELDNPYFI